MSGTQKKQYELLLLAQKLGDYVSSGFLMYPPNSFENFEVFIPMEMNRRTLAKGAAWATPVVVASAAVPAYAASTLPCQTGVFEAPSPGNKREGTTTSWTVPAGVTSICFTVLGGAGGTGGTTRAPLAGGAGAKITGTLPVTPGDTLTLVVGAGGANAARGSQQAGTEVALGGTGYGDGGDANVSPYDGINVTGGDYPILQRLGGSGGAGSAILLNGQPVVIAGGGGGGANPMNYGYLRNTGDAKWKGEKPSLTNQPGGGTNTSTQVAGSAGGANANATGQSLRTNNDRAEVPGAIYTFGSTANAGVAGVGGVPASNDMSSNDTGYNLVPLFQVGNAGGSVSAPGAAKGGDSVALDSYQEGYRNAPNHPDNPNALITSTRLIFGSGAGGGGYGGGASGNVAAWQGSWKNNVLGQTPMYKHNIIAAHPGAAGGSYVASVVADGVIAQGDNSNTTALTRVPGAISFSY